LSTPGEPRTIERLDQALYALGFVLVLEEQVSPTCRSTGTRDSAREHRMPPRADAGYVRLGRIRYVDWKQPAVRPIAAPRRGP
jgi:hypothetical protein